MMSDHEFSQIRRQLELWETSDPDTLDVGPAREMFADCRALLRRCVNAAQVTGGRGLSALAGGDSGRTLAVFLAGGSSGLILGFLLATATR